MKEKGIDKLLLFGIIGICILGIIMVYSSSYVWAEYKFNDPFKYLKNQSLFFLIGIFLMYFVSKINYKIYYDKTKLLLFGSILLLILVLIPGIGTIRNGSRSWFGIGSFGIQPSEFAKLSLIIFTARYLSNNEKEMKSVTKGIFPILGITFFIFGLIMLQPDFGTGVIIVIAPYRLERILSFLDPWKDPLGSGFQIIQSLYAIGPGGLFGQGFLQSRQKHFYLPEPQTDFIFSIISEEFGFLGVLMVVGFFSIIIIQGFRIAKKTENVFCKYLAFGITFGLAFQAILNLMVVVGLIPVTGVTLPFLSYGGSSLLVSMASIGIILNISRK